MGLEPITSRLTAECSTFELQANKVDKGNRTLITRLEVWHTSRCITPTYFIKCWRPSQNQLDFMTSFKPCISLALNLTPINSHYRKIIT